MRGSGARRASVMVLAVLTMASSSIASAIPAAAATNPILGTLDPASPQANQYSGCVAATLVGNGFSFGSLGLLGTQLGALWPNIPGAVAQGCKTAIDSGQPQVCLVPNDPTVCNGIGSALNHFWALQAAALDTWDLTPDSGFFGGSAFNHYPADVSVANGPQARITFTIGQLSPSFAVAAACSRSPTSPSRSTAARRQGRATVSTFESTTTTARATTGSSVSGAARVTPTSIRSRSVLPMLPATCRRTPFRTAALALFPPRPILHSRGPARVHSTAPGGS